MNTPGEQAPFDPDWVVAPAATLAGLMTERGWTQVDLARRCAEGLDVIVAWELIGQVLARHYLGREHAECLAAGTGISEEFWLRREYHYRAGLAAGKTDTTRETTIPVNETSDRLGPPGETPAGGPALRLHTQWVGQAREALRGERDWEPHLTRPEVLADAAKAEFAALRETVSAVTLAMEAAGLWPRK